MLAHLKIIPEIFIRSFVRRFLLAEVLSEVDQRYVKTTKLVMKKLIRQEILKCWTLLFILVTYTR